MITRSSSSVRVMTHPSSRTSSSWKEKEKEQPVDEIVPIPVRAG